MGRFAKSTTIEVLDGLYIKQSAQGAFYQAYSRIDGASFRKSTKCKDLEQAKLAAIEMFYDAKRRAKDGIGHNTVSFKKLAEVYLSFIQHEHKCDDYHRPTTNRHFMPFFEKFKDIRKIKAADINDYLAHRRNKNAEAPSPQTLNRENSVLRQMLAHAVQQGWITQAPKIEHQNDRQHRRRRSHFTHKEYRLLYNTARSRIARIKDEPLRQYTLWQRQLLLDVIMLLANSGMRVDEMKTVTWRNVDLEERYIKLNHAGKVKTNRKVVLRTSAINALKRLRQRREAWLDANEIEAKINDAEKVIMLPNGTLVSNFKKGFDALLDDCGFQYKDKHEKHALTSLRHTYATFSLTRSDKAKRPSMRALSMQMGTSEEMIRRHYGHDEIMDYEDELRGE